MSARWGSAISDLVAAGCDEVARELLAEVPDAPWPVMRARLQGRIRRGRGRVVREWARLEADAERAVWDGSAGEWAREAELCACFEMALLGVVWVRDCERRAAAGELDEYEFVSVGLSLELAWLELACAEHRDLAWARGEVGGGASVPTFEEMSVEEVVEWLREFRREVGLGVTWAQLFEESRALYPGLVARVVECDSGCDGPSVVWGWEE